jgi:outer membrane lipoprotein SlyB
LPPQSGHALAVGVATLSGLVPQSIGSQQEEIEIIKPPEPAVYREYAEAPRVAEAPQPVIQPVNLGTVQALREVTQPGEHTTIGALGGAFAGKHIEKQARATQRWEVEVRHDNGVQETLLSDVAPPYHAGDRVRVVDGRLQPA